MGIFYSPRIPTNGLVFAVDPANSKSYSGSGTTWTDLTESRNNATLQNTPTFNSTNNQGTFSFDGVNERASFAFTNLPVGTSAGTMCAWAKSSLASAPSGAYVISYGSTGAQGEWRGLLQLGTQFLFTGFGLEASGGTVIQNVWHFWTGVYDGTNVLLYADGVLLQSIARAWITGTTGTPNIGATPTNSAYWSGEISQCLIYNRALSAEEIRQIYNATRGRFGK